MGMRRGHDNGWMFDDKDKLIAINLGADFTAEHEWGIQKLNRTLGVAEDDKVLGIERYRITLPHPECVLLFEEMVKEKPYDKPRAKAKEVLHTALVVVEPYDVKYYKDRKMEDLARSGELSLYGEQTLGTAWCESSFGIRTNSEKEVVFLKKLRDAIMNKEAAMWLGGGHVFQNAGLCIGIIDAIPEASKKLMYDAHVDYNKLQEASAKTGIKEKIDALNEEWRKQNPRSYNPPLGYYALRPAWFKGLGRGLKSAHPVMYWLNPQNQDVNDSNWYTVEQLEQWIKGEGPVLKKDKKVS